MILTKDFSHPYISKPLKNDIFYVRVLILLAFCVTAYFLLWLILEGSSSSLFIFSLVVLVFSFRTLKWWHEWYHYWSPSVPVCNNKKLNFTVDVFTTFCKGEPKEMLLNTLMAIKNIRYPHHTFLCDESDDADLRKFCVQHDIRYITRKDKRHAKAGNINNALTHSNAEIVLILDPDHVPVPDFLERVLPYFNDKKIGFVQCIQSYSNQGESFVARASAEQSFHFYGPMMMTSNSYGTVQAIGANCTFRRSALDSIGGHAAGLAEDMHTSMRLHAEGWKSVYVPEVLSKGLTPSSLVAYYKQQLKWTRGVFELLFCVLPVLFFKLNLRQRIYYITSSLFFLSGVIQFIEVFISLYSLGFSVAPLKLDIVHFFSLLSIILLLNYTIRVFVQRWLPMNNEQGFHLKGGILLSGSWWVFLLGFFYSLFRIQVPYLPTPKNTNISNDGMIYVPNILLITFSSLMIYYGLHRDFTPFSILLCGILCLQLFPLLYLYLVWIKKISIKNDTIANSPKVIIKHWITFLDYLYRVLYRMFERKYHMLTLIAIVFIVSFIRFIPFNLKGNSFNVIESAVKGNISNLSLKILKIGLMDSSLYSLSDRLNSSREFSFSPMIILLDKQNSMESNANLLNSISYGYMDRELEFLSNCMLTYHRAVFISFPLHLNEENISSKVFCDAWRYVFEYFNAKGVSNLVWLYPFSCVADSSFPGRSYVDAFSCSSIESRFMEHYKYMEKPVFNFSSDIFSLDNSINVVSGFKLNKSSTNSFISFTPDENSTKKILEKEKNISDEDFTQKVIRCKDIRKNSDDEFFHFVNGKPFFIRGIAYNVGHDWRDGSNFPSREQLSNDFKLIKQMGANVIRRYSSDIYDDNILSIAKENGLMVQFGFWFDPKIDYSSDSGSVELYVKQVHKTVDRLKDDPSILSWTIGNECWGQLKHHYDKPYLISVRHSYVVMLEEMAKLIHEIDPNRPVITCIEHEESQLPSELTDLRKYAPSLDAIGINSYYKAQISKLDSVFLANDTTRPYLVSEFGPEGYWNYHYNHVFKNRLVEESNYYNADWYAYQWKNYIEPNSKNCLGGVAYCWQDRMEATWTWFGISDYKNRLKPVYWKLLSLWNSDKKHDEYLSSKVKLIQEQVGNKIFFILKNSTTETVFNHIDWKVLEADYLQPYHQFILKEDKTKLIMQIPKEDLRLRVYVFLSDNHNNVLTYSEPVFFDIPLTLTSRESANSP